MHLEKKKNSQIQKATTTKKPKHRLNLKPMNKFQDSFFFCEEKVFVMRKQKFHTHESYQSSNNMEIKKMKTTTKTAEKPNSNSNSKRSKFFKRKLESIQLIPEFTHDVSYHQFAYVNMMCSIIILSPSEWHPFHADILLLLFLFNSLFFLSSLKSNYCDSSLKSVIK